LDTLAQRSPATAEFFGDHYVVMGVAGSGDPATAEGELNTETQRVGFLDTLAQRSPATAEFFGDHYVVMGVAGSGDPATTEYG
jgi:hypothetical protein